jgi:hypothetical protein
MCGRRDVFLSDMTPSDVIAFICAFTAWARSEGTWSGETIIQSLSAARHMFRINYKDFTVFSSDSLTALRKALRLTDWFDEALRNDKLRIPFTMDMMNTSAGCGHGSDDPHTVMVATAIKVAAALLLRASEYTRTSGKTTLTPDHMLRSNNVAFFLKNTTLPVSASQLRKLRLSRPASQSIVTSVNITIIGSKTDVIRNGTVFNYSQDDMELDDPTNLIAMLERWAVLVNHNDTDPFFSYPQESTGTLKELHAEDITRELRRIARLYNFPESELYRFTCHSIRIGMATHLHNLGIDSAVILKMGRWSAKSSAAARYQRLGPGVCSIVAKAMTREGVRKGQTASDSIKTLIRPKNSRHQYGQEASVVRTDPHRATDTRHPNMESVLVASDSTGVQSSFPYDQQWRAQQPVSPPLILRHTISNTKNSTNRSGALRLRNTS